MNHLQKSLIVWMAFLAIPSHATAQIIASSFDELQTLIKPGDRIDVVDSNGRTTKGKLGQLSASSLELLVRTMGSDGRETAVPKSLLEPNVSQIFLRRGDPIWTGALIGFAPGGTIGMLILFWGAGCDCYTVASRAPFALGTMLIAGGLGAGLGAAVDAAIVEKQTVFMRPSRRASGVHVSPWISATSAGMSLSVGF